MEGLFDSQIAERLLGPASKPDGTPLAEQLVRAALQSGGGHDNITAMVIELM
jgi:serine/threonine protein phosphatase PrpC